MTKIKNIEGLTIAEINQELSNGAKFVIYKYCVSVIVLTFRRSSDIYFVRGGESTIKNSIGFTLVTFLFGWWGIPWGPIYSIGSLYTNLTGGEDITQNVIKSINSK